MNPGGRRPLLVAVGLTLTALGACVIAEPPADLPTLPAEAPQIQHASVVPPPTAVITRWPDKFIVPVKLADPRSSFQYSAFTDYNPTTGDGLRGFGTSDFDLQTEQGSTRLLEVAIPEPSSDGCHTVELVVALQLSTPSDDGRAAHTPREPGGDSVSWFYSPSGDLAGCPFLDAGLQPDAQALESLDASFP